MARPAFEVNQEIIDKCEKLAAQGLTLEQVAHCIGICYKTLNEKKKQFSELSDAIKRGQAAGIEQVSNALFDKAITGDNTSMIFYLKNRDQKNWGDRPIEQDTTAESLTINFQVAQPVGEIKTTIGKPKDA